MASKDSRLVSNSRNFYIGKTGCYIDRQHSNTIQVPTYRYLSGGRHEALTFADLNKPETSDNQRVRTTKHNSCQTTRKNSYCGMSPIR
ncbi:hypothetical protein MTR_6g012320 [Medicago truncatula]|uniref:Uncharacterized protein n=1 Tax=Medicago truncatula TaxID=3880 RepID=G7KKI3_MEDTR|nr:hypothetical protein MTR_6g012320 [Medicago truncatula]